MFHEVLPAVVAAEDPGRFYTRSSPSANDDKRAAPTSAAGATCTTGASGTPRHPYEAYADNISRFMSEYGFQSFPELGVGGALHAARRRLEHRVARSCCRTSATRAATRSSARTWTATSASPRTSRRSSTSARCCRRWSSSTPPRRTGARMGAQLGQPLLAARRLLAGRLVVGHRLLRALEGAALLRAPLLRAGAGQPGRARRASCQRLGDLRPPHRRAARA